MCWTFVNNIKVLFVFEYFYHSWKHFAFLAELHVFIFEDFIPGEFVLKPFEKN